MALTMTAMGTVIGKENVDILISSFTINVPPIKANSKLFAERLEHTTGSGGGYVMGYTISNGVSFTQAINNASGSSTLSVGWELII